MTRPCWRQAPYGAPFRDPVQHPEGCHYRVGRTHQKITRTHPERALFADLPGAGSVLLPRLIVAFGTQRERFASADELASYSGIAPVTQQSGQTVGTLPAGLPEVSAPDLSRVRQPLHPKVCLGPCLL